MILSSLRSGCARSVKLTFDMCKDFSKNFVGQIKKRQVAKMTPGETTGRALYKELVIFNLGAVNPSVIGVVHYL